MKAVFFGRLFHFDIHTAGIESNVCCRIFITHIETMLNLWGNHNHSSNIWDKLYFSYEIAHYGESSISAFQEIVTRTVKILISGGGRQLDNNCMKFWDFPDNSFFAWTFFFFYMYLKCSIIKIWILIHAHIHTYKDMQIPV